MSTWYTPKQARDRFDVTDAKLMRMVTDGRLTMVKQPNGHRRFQEDTMRVEKTLGFDVLQIVFEATNNTLGRGRNWYGELRLVCSTFAHIIAQIGCDLLARATDLDRVESSDGLVYIIAANRFVGTERSLGLGATAKDLQTIDHSVVKNGCRTTFLYLKQSVIQLGVRRHGSLSTANDTLLSKAEKRASKRKSAREIRERELVKELRSANASVRPDSRLCKGYIDGTLRGWSLPMVVQRTVEVQFLFKHLDMKGCLKQAEREQRDELEAGYFPDISLFDQAEHIALEKIGGKYPDDLVRV